MTDSSPPPLLSIITTTDPAARQLPKLLDALSSLATQMSQSFEVIVIDDLKLWPSSDDCHLDTYPGLVIHPLWYPEYRGQLRAMLSGIMIAQGDSILTIDPDMHPCVPEIPGMQSLMAQGYDIVHGERTYRPDISWLRQQASAIVNITVRLVGGIKVSDIGSPIALLQRTTLFQLEGSRLNGNPRLNLYRLLGDRVACYPLTHGCPANTDSQYSLIMLIMTFLILFKDCFLLRLTPRPESTSHE